METQQDTTSLIKERFLELPVEVQSFITASDFPQKMKEIAKEHNLMLDQSGILQQEILLVMLGLEPSSDFVGNISKELEISRSEAVAIAQDVNDRIFSTIKTYLREWEEQAEQTQEKTEEQSAVSRDRDISAIERAGNFEILNDNDVDKGADDIDGGNGINTIESANAGGSTEKYADNHTEPLADHLLGNPVVSVEQKIVHEAKPIGPTEKSDGQTKPENITGKQESATPAQKKGYEKDPYREPVE